MGVRKNAELAGKALANSLNMGGTGHGRAKATNRPLGQPVIFIIRQGPIHMALQIGQGGQHEAVLHGWTMGEGHRRE